MCSKLCHASMWGTLPRAEWLGHQHAGSYKEPHDSRHRPCHVPHQAQLHGQSLPENLLALEVNRAALVSCALGACKRNIMLHACCAHAWHQYSPESQLEVLLN